ncbi:MAG: right-handed parallel beta-helix repeat-containing protein [Chloroflexota bacterium]
MQTYHLIRLVKSPVQSLTNSSVTIHSRSLPLLFAVLGTLLFLLSFNHSTGQAKQSSTPVGGIIDTNTTWTKLSSPYVLSSTVTIAENIVLTIEPGTVIKASDRQKILLESQATLNAVGTAGEPIVFTSLKDDEFAGDTNGDGTASVPTWGDWTGIEGRKLFSSSGPAGALNLEHVIFRYSQEGILAGGNLTLHDSTIELTRLDGVTVRPAADTSPEVSIQRTTFRGNGRNSANYDELLINGQPAQLLIQDNTFETVDTFSYALYLTGVSVAEIRDNTVTQNGSQSAIFLENTTEQVILADNTLTKTGALQYSGIVVRDGTPTLTDNRITGFGAAVTIDGGYPQMVPTYSGNNFVGNLLQGIGVSGSIVSGTWTDVGGLTHFLHDDATVQEGATLTIPAGTVIKSFGDSLRVGARATLNAIGTETEPIIFTSGADDEFGGDSNSDDSASVPSVADWDGIFGQGSTSSTDDGSNLNLQYVTIRYAAIGIEAEGSLSLQDSVLAFNRNYGVYVDVPTGDSPNISILSNALRKNATWRGGSDANIRVDGQPEQLTIQENEIDSELYSALALRDVMQGDVSRNTIIHDANSHAVLLNNVTEGLLFQNNQVNRTGELGYAGIEVINGTPTLTGNTIRGFFVPVLVNGGYPQLVPSYTDNIVEGNGWTGIGISGVIKSGTWTEFGEYPHYIFGDVTIEEGAEFTIPAGTVVKSYQDDLTVSPRATLNAIGTAEAPIIFTSLRDDTAGGDGNNDGADTTPLNGNWYGIIGSGENNSTANPSTLNLAFVIIRYSVEAIDARGDLTLQDSLIELNSSDGIRINPPNGQAPNISIQRTIIRDNWNDGIEINGSFSSLTLRENAFSGNSVSGLNNQAENAPLIEATSNWWGDPTGPEELTGNPDGQGDLVQGNVSYTPWLTQLPSVGPGGQEIEPIEPPANIPTLADTFEGDNDCSIATSIATNDSNQEHNFDKQGDTDWIQFEATAGQTYRVEVQTRANSVADVNLEVYDRCDGPVTNQFEETFTPGVRLDLNPLQNGTLYLKLSNYDPDIFGADAVYSVSVRQLKSTSDSNGAVILLEGRLKLSDRVQANIHNVVQRTYQLFKSSGYSDDDIQYLSTNTSTPGYDGPATAEALQNAITTWAADRVGPGKPLTLYMMDHGNIDRLYLDEPKGERVTPAELNSWLNILEEKKPGLKTTIIVEACNSGSFIMGDQSISKVGRLVITSTNVQNVAYASAEGAQFSDRFLTSLREGYGLSNSFWDARLSVRRLYKVQDPWIDANGNGIPNEEADGAEATSDYDPNTSNQPADTWAPYIVRAEGPDPIENGTGTIRAEVRDNNSVAKVWAAVYGPSYDAPESSEELVPEDVPTATFSSQGSNIFSVEYNGFTEAGTYQVALYAEDNDGLKARLMVLEVRNGGGEIYLPVVTQ